MSLVKKTLKEISDKKAKDKKEKTNKPIEIHTIYKDLIKKNNIFKDLKELKKETEKTTPHFFFHLNDNSNNYLAKLKKVDNFKMISYMTNEERYALDALSDCKENRELGGGKIQWLNAIIMADIYFNIKKSTMNIFRIGYALRKIGTHSPNPPFWFFRNHTHGLSDDDIDIDWNDSRDFKSYEKMMTSLIIEIINTIKKNDIEFVKPFGSLSLYKKKYDFIDFIDEDTYKQL